MKLTINREFLRRHLFALVVLAGMGLWFGYDGFVTYPKMPAARLYETIESAPPPDTMTAAALAAFKAQKIATQHGLCYALLLAAAVVGFHLLAVSRVRLAFDESGFTWNGRRYARSDIKGVDRSQWAKKGVLTLTLPDGRVKLDAWHHTGVREFERTFL